MHERRLGLPPLGRPFPSVHNITDRMNDWERAGSGGIAHSDLKAAEETCVINTKYCNVSKKKVEMSKSYMQRSK